MITGRRGQSTLETGILLAAVTAALIVLFGFIRASVASRVKLGADTLGHGLLNNGD